jgi:hypothetical protein
MGLRNRDATLGQAPEAMHGRQPDRFAALNQARPLHLSLSPLPDRNSHSFLSILRKHRSDHGFVKEYLFFTLLNISRHSVARR